MRRASAVKTAGSWDAATAIDRVVLDADARHRRRVTLTGEGGIAFLLRYVAVAASVIAVLPRIVEVGLHAVARVLGGVAEPALVPENPEEPPAMTDAPPTPAVPPPGAPAVPPGPAPAVPPPSEPVPAAPAVPPGMTPGEPGATLVPLAVVGRRDARVGHLGGVLRGEQRPPAGDLVVPRRAPLALDGDRDAAVVVHPCADRVQRGQARPVRRTPLMSALAPEGTVYQAGTLSGNPVAATAGLTTLRLANDAVYAHVDRAADVVREAAVAALTEAGVPHVAQNDRNMFSVFFSEDDGTGPVTDFAGASRQRLDRYAAFFHSMLDHGVYLPPSAYEGWFLSSAHDDRALDRVVDALPAAAAAAAAA